MQRDRPAPASARRLLLGWTVALAVLTAVTTPRSAAGPSSDDVVLETILAPPPVERGGLHPLSGREVTDGPRVALALSGGGARGLAHVGVLMGLRDEGFPIDAIAGTSGGALVGAFAAAGYSPAEIASIMERHDWNALLQDVDLRRSSLTRAEDVAESNALVRLRRRAPERRRAGGLIRPRAFERQLRRYLLRAQLLAGSDFDALRYRFRPVATDLLSATKVSPARGDLATAVLGSAAVPGVLPPVPFEGALLVDGGLLENVPVETARELGADLVVAVDVSDRALPTDEVGGVLEVLNRSVNIMAEAKTRESLELADVVLVPAVGDQPRSEVPANLESLLDAGRRSVLGARDRLWAAWSERCEDEPLAWDELEVAGTGRVGAHALAARFRSTGSGGREALAGRARRCRLRAELARLLRLEPFAAGRVELVGRGERRVLRFVLEERGPLVSVRHAGDVSVGALFAKRDGGPAAPTREDPLGEPFTWPVAERIAWSVRAELLAEGRVLAGLSSADFDATSGLLSLEWDEPRIERITTSPNERRLAWTGRRVASLTGARFRYDALARRLDQLAARGAIRDWSVLPTRDAEGDAVLDVPISGDSYGELAAGLSFRGRLQWAGFLRLARVNPTGRGDRVVLDLEGAEEVVGAQLRYGLESGLGLGPLGGEIGLSWRDGDFPGVDSDQRYREDLEEDFEGGRAWIAVGQRPTPGRALQVGLLHERLRLGAGPTGPRDTHERTAAFARYERDKQDRLHFPTSGSVLRLRGEHSVAGAHLWRLQAEASWAVSLGRTSRGVLVPRVGLAVSEGAERMSLWHEPGGYRRLHGVVPYGAASPQVARAGLAYRRRLLSRGPFDLHVEVGADVVLRSIELSDLHDADELVGLGTALVLHVPLLGPVTLGVATNDEGAGFGYVTAGLGLTRR